MTRRLAIKILIDNPEFFHVLAKHLDRIFPDGWVSKEFDADDIECCVEDTVGWADAFELTCIGMNLREIYMFWLGLEWDESDSFNYLIEEMLCAVVFDKDGNRIKHDKKYLL